MNTGNFAPLYQLRDRFLGDRFKRPIQSTKMFLALSEKPHMLRSKFSVGNIAMKNTTHRPVTCCAQLADAESASRTKPRVDR